MKNSYITLEEMEKKYLHTLNLELKLNYLVTDILFPVNIREVYKGKTYKNYSITTEGV